jgi:RNA polymerase sigma factor (sigma-70 family)
MPTATTTDVASLVRGAAIGDRQAWTSLVDHFSGLIYSVARSHRLNDADSTDVSQTTWLRLVEHIDRIEDPTRVGAWLATTARRESLRVLGMSARQVPTGDESELEPRGRPQPELDEALLAAERDADVRWALEQLPPRCAEMLELLMGDEPLSYSELSERLNIPIGSIGPTRARCLRKLRAILAQAESGAMIPRQLVRR